MRRLPPLLRLYRMPGEYFEHVMDGVSMAPRSVGLHTRRELQDAFRDMPLQLPHWLCWPVQLRPELLPLFACLPSWVDQDRDCFPHLPQDLATHSRRVRMGRVWCLRELPTRLAL